jgi:hypothetical protein
MSNRSKKLHSDIINLAMQLAIEKNKVDEVQNVFQNCNLNDLDLFSISKLEAILGEDLLLIPNKQQWRKIKLQKINSLNK